MTFSGRTLRQCSTEGGSIAETEHGPAALPAHAHPQPTFCLVTRGDLRESTGGSSSHHYPRDLIFRRPGESHANVFGSRGARCFNVVLEPSLVIGSIVALPTGAALPLVQRLRRELYGDPSPLVVEGLLLQLAGELSRSVIARRTLAERVSDIVRTRFADTLTIQSIASEVGAHPVHVMRSFHRQYGRSVAGAIRDLRIDHARELLRGSQPLAEIALACGFADQSHFTRVFRRATGMTPRRFRIALR